VFPARAGMNRLWDSGLLKGALLQQFAERADRGCGNGIFFRVGAVLSFCGKCDG